MRRSPVSAVLPAVVLSVYAVTAAGPAAAAADTCPNAALRTGASASLPNCRAYERVSPLDPNTNRAAGVGAAFTPMLAKARADGERLAFTSAVAVGTVERAGYNAMSIASRGSGGWTTFGVLTGQGDFDLEQAGHSAVAAYPARDLSRVGLRLARGVGGGNPGTNNSGSTYLTAPGGKGAPLWLSQPLVGGTLPAAGNGVGNVFGGSPDLSTAYFGFVGKLTDAYGDGARTSQGLYAYRDGALQPAGRLPTGNVDSGGAMPAGSGSTSYAAFELNSTAVRPSVSLDGESLFFVTPYGSGADIATTRQLYVQQGGCRQRRDLGRSRVGWSWVRFSDDRRNGSDLPERVSIGGRGALGSGPESLSSANRGQRDYRRVPGICNGYSARSK
jgi:hypothetical protein